MLITFNCKLHLNLLNLLFSMFLVSFCIIEITVCYITKLQNSLYLTTLFLCDFLAFLLISISYINFIHFSKFIFMKRSFTKFLYITSFIEVVYWCCIYFLYIILLQHGNRETNPGRQKEKLKIYPAVIGMLISF